MSPTTNSPTNWQPGVCKKRSPCLRLALLDRAFKLAVQKRLISQRARPYIEKPAEDPSRVRKGFFTREQVESAIAHAAKTDRMIKGLVRGDAWDELLQLGLRFASGAPGRPAVKRGKMPAPAHAAERSQNALF